MITQTRIPLPDRSTTENENSNGAFTVVQDGATLRPRVRTGRGLTRMIRPVALLLLVTVTAGATWAMSSPQWAEHLLRCITWGDSDVMDYQKFPARGIANAAPLFNFAQDPSPELFQTIEYGNQGRVQQADFEELLRATQTTAFIVIQDDNILHEGYYNGYTRDSVVTSFSMAKSFGSALIGIAIDEGYIGSVQDPVIKYIPELRGRGLDELTIRHLLTMSSGIEYTEDEGMFVLQKPFSGDALTYYYPDLRDLALDVQPSGDPIGSYYHYNNYHPLLLGMILERTTHRPVAEYLEEKIWQQLGMEYPASWSLDSEEAGFEKMESGINGRAIDFARFGRLYLNNGNWNGKQIVSEEWVRESTSPDPTDSRPWHVDQAFKENGGNNNGYYGYMWWGRTKGEGKYNFYARGHLGQIIAVSHEKRAVVVRFGKEGGEVSWPDVADAVFSKLP